MELPARIGKYQLEEFLGGGMSHVYRARDTILGRTVAVKILTEQGCRDPETKARFLQEARMAANFTHDNIIRVFDFGEDNGLPFMIMEFLKGETLREAIRNGHTGDLKGRLRIALELARALEYIHSLKIVHRDIKPDNVHIDMAGRVKLMDFGIAKSQNVSLTKVGFTLGTPYYMAPEQVLGHNVTHLVDVYAFGALLFEIIAGQKAVTADSIERAFQQILNEPLDMEPVRQACPLPSVRDLIERCTAKDAADRVQSFEMIRGEIERIIRGMTMADIPTMAPGISGSMPSQSFTAQRSASMPASAPSSRFAAQTEGAVITPPAAPAPVRVPVAPVAAEAEALPEFMKRLPPRFHTQEWFITIVALTVLFGIVIAVLFIGGLMRLMG